MLPCSLRSAEAISIFERAQFDEGSSRGHTIALVYLEQRRPEEACRKGGDGLTQVLEVFSVLSLYEGASFLWDLLGSDDHSFERFVNLLLLSSILKTTRAV